MELLQRIEDRGYPAEYLLSRVRSRRIRYRDFIFDESPEVIWKHLLIEYKWVYIQMNNRLRSIFHSFFLYHELRTLTFCLRYKSSDAHSEIEELLRFSLLSGDLKGLIEEGLKILPVIENIEKVFLSLSSEFGGLSEAYVKDGFKGFEQNLKDSYLRYVIANKLHPVMRDFFMYLIDMKNIINLYKHLRWEVLDYPSFIHGGNIKEGGLRRIFKEQNISGFVLPIYNLTGIRIEKISASSIENSLLKWITVSLKRAGRDPLSIGVILDYLWRCYIETMNRSIALYGSELGRDVVTSEMVR